MIECSGRNLSKRSSSGSVFPFAGRLNIHLNYLMNIWCNFLYAVDLNIFPYVLLDMKNRLLPYLRCGCMYCR